MKQTILIADDDDSVLTVLEHAVRRQGFSPLCTDDGSTLMQWVEQGKGHALITDVLMPYGARESSSFEWIPRIRAMRPELPVIVISAQNTLHTAVKAGELGAFDYLPKPFDLTALMDCLEKALRQQPENRADIAQLSKSKAAALIGASPAMQRIYRSLARVVQVDLTIFITGESGTGKELVARAVHELGARKAKPFVAVNMAAIPKELVESELFGHEKGAFTGANTRKSGKFEQAEGGTLFLDEIGDMPLEAQSKLLRVLQEGEYTSVGGTRTLKTNVRIICATHRDMRELVAAGAFREDLYYRINVVPVDMPPLRERSEDVPLLARHFLRKAMEKGLPEKTLSQSALVMLQGYHWPGNIRELENLMYRVCTLAPERGIDVDTLTRYLATAAPRKQASDPGKITSLEEYIGKQLEAYFAAHEGALPPSGLYERLLPLLERPLIQQAMHATGGNQLRAAHLLGINRNTLRKRLHELGIEK